MAEVRQCLRKRVQDFANKLYNRYLLESQKKHGKSAAHTSSLSAGFLLVDIKNGGLYGAENAADGVTVLPGRYTRVNPLLGAADWENGNVAEKYHGSGEYSLSRKTKVQINERNIARYRSYAKFWRAFSSSMSQDQSRCGRHEQLVFIRAFSGNGGRSEPLYKTRTGYYEILEVSPTATQAQVKTAYYKQSFIYHPDRNPDSDDATVRFSEINEAYTVLGSKALRKKYDRGLLSLSDLTATPRPSGKDTARSSEKQQAGSRRSVVGSDIRGGSFDLDTFLKFHYGEQLQKQRELRVRKEELLKKKEESKSEMKLGRMLEVVAGLLLLAGMGLIVQTIRR